MTNQTRYWLAWGGVSVIVAYAAALAVGFLLPNYETSIVLFGVGCAWSASTPAVIRAIGRRLR